MRGTDSTLPALDILTQVYESGFQQAAVFPVKEIFSRIPALFPPRNAKQICADIHHLLKNIHADYRKGSLIVCALSCFVPEPDDLSTEEEPHGLIGPFARRNYYRASVLKLKKIAGHIAETTGTPRRSIRIFCNSRFPEKPVAYAAGMGFYGKNSLLITEELGSLFVISLLYVPLPLETVLPDTQKTTQAQGCGSCTACMDACPVSAIPKARHVDVNLCIQALSIRTKPLPETARRHWGFRIYGCQTCQEACPYNKNLSRQAHVTLGDLGPSIPLVTLLGNSEKHLRDLFRKTALGMSWIPARALIRNACIAAGHRRNRHLVPFLRQHASGEDTLLAEEAKRALQVC